MSWEAPARAALTTRNALMARIGGWPAHRPLEIRTVQPGEILLHPEAPLYRLILPLEAVVSVMVCLADGTTCEVELAGPESAVGIGAYLGLDSYPWTATCVVGGLAALVNVADLRAMTVVNPMVDATVRACLASSLAQRAITAACNRLHAAEARFARQLLMIVDRAGGAFPMTHDLMADRLGIHRPSVSLIAHELQRTGAIWYRHGRLRVLDRAQLEAVSCECYGLLGQETDRALGAHGAPSATC